MCVKFRDLSPLLPLSWRDFIYLEVFEAKKDEMDSENRIVFDDVAFYLRRLSLCFTGDERMNFLPSEVARMARVYAARQRR